MSRVCACFGFHSSATAGSLNRLTEPSKDFRVNYEIVKLDCHVCSQDRTRNVWGSFLFMRSNFPRVRLIFIELRGSVKLKKAAQEITKMPECTEIIMRNL